jgi:hypothetical protein
MQLEMPRAAAPLYDHVVARLCARSVTKHVDAYADIDWDDPANRIDPEDPRFELAPDDPLAHTAWYRGLPQAARADLGLLSIASTMKTGVCFEAILAQGLLEFASTRPDGSPELRYAYHELIEEAQHSLMFLEFIRRSGMRASGLTRIEAVSARGVPRLGRTFPELFFLHVLAGETPNDHVQRTMLERGPALHPLVSRIMHAHVTEEARHVCFAVRFLEERIPRLGAWRMARLRLAAPFVLANTARAMLRVPHAVVRAYDLPPEVLAEADGSRCARGRLHAGLAPVRALCERLRVWTPRTALLWKWLGV